MIGLLDRSLQ